MQLPYNELLWPRLIVYIGKNTKQIPLLQIDIVEFWLISLVQSLFMGKLHEQVERPYLVGISLRITHLRKRILVYKVLIQGLVYTSNTLGDQK